MDEASSMKKRVPTVMIIDDDDFARETLRATLGEIGLTEVRMASNGREALNILANKAEPPLDYLFIDVFMPDMDGIELINALAPHKPSKGVFLVTGVNIETLSMAIELANGLDIKVLGAFTKPVQLRSLISTIQI